MAKARRRDGNGFSGAVWALYDQQGLRQPLIEHLDWLNASLPLKTVSVSDVTRMLEGEVAA